MSGALNDKSPAHCDLRAGRRIAALRTLHKTYVHCAAHVRLIGLFELKGLPTITAAVGDWLGSRLSEPKAFWIS
ncbi:hypothetical protein NXC24_PB00437 (plasmid) [Rhizobium sp. NXC24]|nr:hypothetical protein NXC24_PB00437 [Rhizobium sp. NXC24]